MRSPCTWDCHIAKRSSCQVERSSGVRDDWLLQAILVTVDEVQHMCISRRNHIRCPYQASLQKFQPSCQLIGRTWRTLRGNCPQWAQSTHRTMREKNETLFWAIKTMWYFGNWKSNNNNSKIMKTKMYWGFTMF